MKKLLQIKFLLLITIASGMLYAAVTLQYFTARDNASGVMVEWKTGDEVGTAKFEIERSADSPDNFICINFKEATGNNSYYRKLYIYKSYYGDTHSIRCKKYLGKY